MKKSTMVEVTLCERLNKELAIHDIILDDHEVTICIIPLVENSHAERWAYSLLENIIVQNRAKSFRLNFTSLYEMGAYHWAVRILLSNRECWYRCYRSGETGPHNEKRLSGRPRTTSMRNMSHIRYETLPEYIHLAVARWIGVLVTTGVNTHTKSTDVMTVRNLPPRVNNSPGMLGGAY